MEAPYLSVYSTSAGLVVQRAHDFLALESASWDDLFTASQPAQWLASQLTDATPIPAPTAFLAPIGSQEVWAAGVTYLRSRDARMEESKDAGGGTFYDRVYEAERPEIFFKATPHRVVPPGQPMRLRSDSRWNVPEPELALAINSSGSIFGYTVANDLSSRDIEGENPLYLPQAKVWSHCCALGPGVVIRDSIPAETRIELRIVRRGFPVYQGATSISRMKRSLPDLAGWLFRDNTFPKGCFFLTGTGLVPPDTFSLAPGDEVRISIDELGTLTNLIA